MNTTEFVATTEFQDAVEEIRKRTGCIVLPKHNPGLDELRLKAAKLKTEDLVNILNSEFEKIVSFSVEKRKIPPDHDDNEHAKGEKPGRDEKPTNVKVLGWTKNGLVFNLIEYILMRKGGKELEEYLKAIRLPKIPQFSKQLRKALKDSDN
jgi:hypothetical protein